MDIKNFKDILFKKALSSGFESCEIFYSSSDSFKVNVYKGNLEKYQNRNSSGFGFRGLYNDKMGYYFSENIDESIIDSVIKNAKENSEILSSAEKEFIFEGSDKYSKVKVYDESINNLSIEDKIKMATDMENIALNYSDKVKAVNTSTISTGESNTYIANTKGLELEEKSNYFMAYVEVVAQDGDSIKENGEIYLATHSKFSANDIAKNACDKAINALNGNSVKSGKYKAVIKNETFADILDCFAGNFYGEQVHRGFSLLKDKIGSKIANDIITIVDDPLLDYGNMTTAFDSEGVASFTKNVVENGELKTYLHNLKSANKAGTKSTGNGFKSSFKGSVATSHTNFYIKNGSDSFDTLLQKVDNGIYITEVTGLHAGANGVSGDFSLAADGFLIENGKITSPVEQITIAGNFYNILLNIENIGNDMKFNTSAVGSPSIVVDIDVAGL